MAKSTQTKSASTQSKSAWPGGAVRISMPASVANDLEAFKKSLGAVAERLGCPSCFSGVDCTFQMERNFVIDEKLKVASGSAASREMALTTTAGASRGVTVSMPTEAHYDINKIIKITDLIGRDLGKHWQSGGLAFCCSGFDITFERELNFISDNDGNIRPRG